MFACPRWIRLLPLLLLPLLCTEVPAAELRETGRKIAKEYESALVSVEIVIGMKVGNDEREQKLTINGTVIDEHGLTLVPLEGVDPASMIRRMVGDRAEEMQIESRVKDIKIKIDKVEMEATVVLRDADLNLAFLRPTKKPKAKMKFFDFKEGAKPELLEELLVVTRMGRIADNVVGVMTGEVQAIFERPRTFYIPSAELASGGVGVPIVNADGKMIGIIQMRLLSQAEREGSGADLFGIGPDSSSMAVILPASDVVEMQEQAPAPEE